MWKLIEISFANPEHLFNEGFRSVVLAESILKPSHLYFAHYNQIGTTLLRIVVETDADNYFIKESLENRIKYMDNISVIDGKEPGSLAHSLGYDICKILKDDNKETKKSQLYDIIHWMQNMLGFTDIEEEANYLEWAKYSRKNYLSRQ